MLEKHVFKHKNGGKCEVYTPRAIEKLRKDKNYSEVKEEVKENKKVKEEEITPIKEK